jgi:hypothetical protein
VSAEPTTDAYTADDTDFAPPERTRDEEVFSRQLSAAITVAVDLLTVEALALGETVPTSQIRSEWIKWLGLNGDGFAIDEATARRIELLRRDKLVQPGEDREQETDAPTAPDPTVTVDEFIERKDENGATLMRCEQGTAVPPAGLVLLVSKAGAGKTTIADDWALHAGAGREWIGFTFDRPLRVLLIENEGPREAFREKLELRLASWTPRDDEHAEPIRIWDDPARWGGVRLSNEEQLAQLRGIVDQHRIDICISDSLTRFGMKGNGTPEETREFVDLLTQAGLTRDLAFVLLHHPITRPDQVVDELERIAGAWPPHADAIFFLQKLPGLRARLSFPKLRWARGVRPASILSFDPAAETFALVAEETDGDDRDYIAELTEALADGEWRTVNALRQPASKGGIGAREDAIKDALADPRFETANGETIGKRRGASYYRLTDPHNSHGNPHENPHGRTVGHVGQQTLRDTGGEATPTSHHHVSGGTVGGASAATPDNDDDIPF